MASDGKNQTHVLIGKELYSWRIQTWGISQGVAYVGLDPGKDVNKSRLANCIKDR